MHTFYLPNPTAISTHNGLLPHGQYKRIQTSRIDHGMDDVVYEVSNLVKVTCMGCSSTRTSERLCLNLYRNSGADATTMVVYSSKDESLETTIPPEIIRIAIYPRLAMAVGPNLTPALYQPQSPRILFTIWIKKSAI
jgi:hypothetical protein